MKEEEKKSRLFKWFADFAYADLYEMSPGDLGKLIIEIQLLVWTGFFEENRGQVTMAVGGYRVEQYVPLQQEFKSRFTQVLDEISGVRKMEDPGWITLKDGFQKN